METEGSHPQPKRSKPSNHDEFSMKSSSFKIPILPGELIIEIVLRLPVKSLLQFRCVSKSWCYLICSRKFVNTHLDISTNNKDCSHHRLMMTFDYPYHNLMDCSISSLIYDSVVREFHLDYPMKNPHKPVLVIGCVDGLICFSICENIFIWNPSIKKFKKLRDSRYGYYVWYGFGYDQLHADYKVLIYCDTSHCSEVRIYSSNTNSWRTIVDDLPHVGLFEKPEGIIVNGKLHWANSPSRDRHLYNGWVITSIDVTDGKWEKLEKPSYGEGDFNLAICVGVLESDLSVLCSNQSMQTDVWIMKDYGVKESWTKMYTININHPNDHFDGYHFYDFSPFFCMSNKGEILFEGSKSTFMIYNTKDDSIRYQKVTNYDFFSEVNVYVESLVWPFYQKERMQRWVQHLRRLKKQQRMQQWMQQVQRLKKLRGNQLCIQ